MVRKGLMVLLGLAGAWIVLHVALHRPTEHPYLISHRGAAGLAPENTIASLRAGIQSGAEQIEIDVQRTADGALILYHDAQLDGRAIGDYRWSELTAKRVDGEPIPTFDEVLEVFDQEAADGTILAIEGKDPANYPGIAREIVQAVEAHHLRRRVRIVSFDPNFLREVHALAPEMELGRIYVYPLIVPREEGVRTISLNWIAAVIDPTVIRRIHAKGYNAVVWTTDSPAVMRIMAWLGADGISTNRPDKLVSLSASQPVRSKKERLAISN